MNLNLPVLLSACLLSAQALASGPDFLIVHGATVRADDPIASTTVAILNESQGELSLCSGSIVSSDLVVTAAHCVGPARSGMRLAFTTDIHRTGGTLVPVAGYLRPKDFGVASGEDGTDDIALIRFEGGLPPGYRAAKVLQDASQLKDGETVTLAGFGVTSGMRAGDLGVHGSGGPTGAGVLRRVDVRIAQAVYDRTEVVIDQSSGRGACHGDSGGPAFLRQGDQYLLFGVTSRGTSDGLDECSGASIYTSMLAHAHFLMQAASELRAGRTMP